MYLIWESYYHYINCCICFYIHADQIANNYVVPCKSWLFINSYRVVKSEVNVIFDVNNDIFNPLLQKKIEKHNTHCLTTYIPCNIGR